LLLTLSGCAPRLVSGCLVACSSDSRTAEPVEENCLETNLEGRCPK
jgi:hypothetical protein